MDDKDIMHYIEGFRGKYVIEVDRNSRVEVGFFKDPEEIKREQEQEREYRDKIFEFRKSEKWDEIIDYITTLINRRETPGRLHPYSLYEERGRAYKEKAWEKYYHNREEMECAYKEKDSECKDYYRKALNDYETAIKYYTQNFGGSGIEHDFNYCHLCFSLALLYEDVEEYNKARKYLVCASGIEELQYVNESLKRIENSAGMAGQKFTDQDYHDRKFVMPVTKLNGCKDTAINVFTMNDLPKDIHFHKGFVKPYELYIGHPFIKDYYVPYKDSEEEFFEDKVGELCLLLQALGAVEIDISSIKGMDVSRTYQHGSSFEANAGIRSFSVQGGYNSEDRNYNNYNQNNQKLWKQVFNPKRPAYIPDGLVWYPHELNWQRIARQRLNGGMLGYRFECSSKETTFTSEAESKSINASASYLCVSAGVSHSSSNESTFSEKNETIWVIDVRFC